MKSSEGQNFGQELVTEQEKRAQSILNYIKRITRTSKPLDATEEAEIKKYYAKIDVREKADVLYEKLMAYTVDKQAASARKDKDSEKKDESDSCLINEIKILFEDIKVQETFVKTYSEARVEARKNRLSELGNIWNNLCREIQEKETSFKELERKLHLNKITGSGNISSAESRMARLVDSLAALEERKKKMETLQGFPETAENTDMAAQFQFEQLRAYKQQLEEGNFVWLPTRKKIHQDTVSALLNHRWPVLIGEAGSGKSKQADAAAMELTGHKPTELECEATTGKSQMIEDTEIDPDTGGSFKEYGPVMAAFTGFEDSRQEKPSFTTGRIVRFDESGRMGPKAYTIIKSARQKKPGDSFFGKPMLPGSSAIWTSNPVGPRYPDRHAPDPAMRRELAEIHVPYPDMSAENPELFEFALVALMDKNDHIAVAEKELAPAYEKKEIPENERKVLEDGSIVIAKDELITDMSDARHGSLWRFTGAIKALQDSFVNGNIETKKYPDSLLRFKEDSDGNIEITSDGSGEPLTLSSSTVTLGELASWMSGFNERRKKRDTQFHVDTLSEWLDFKINTYLKQTDEADREKIRAIFKHFNFLEGKIPETGREKPLTPKEIGYLSPRVPRPLYLEKPVVKIVETPEETEDLTEIKEYETKRVLLEDGTRVLIKVREFSLGQGTYDLEAGKLTSSIIEIGKKIKIGDKIFSFGGVVEDPGSKHNGEPVGQEDELYRVFSAEDLDKGILAHEVGELIKDMDELIPKLMENYWKTECLNNQKNNPDNIALII